MTSAAKRVLFGPLALALMASAHAVELQPFEWHYDVVYTQKKRAYNGRGSYKLARHINDTWSFSLSVKTHSRIFSSKDEVLLYADAQKIVVPLERKQRTTLLGVPRNKKIELDLDNEYPYDALTAILRLLYDLRTPDTAPSQWQFWMADEKKYQNYIMRKEEKLLVAGRSIMCYVIEKVEDKPGKSLTIWVAKNGNYIVKMTREYGDTRIKMELSTNLKTSNGVSI